MNNTKNFIRLLFHPRRLLAYAIPKGPFNELSDEVYLKLLYFVRFGRFLNLENPKSYNEKLQWLKINDRNPEYVTDVDKWEVRNKIETLFPDRDLLVPVVSVFNNFDEIDFDALPQAFVLKCTHGTHCSIVCKNKNTFDKGRARTLINDWMLKNYYYESREWPYLNVHPRIVCEHFIQDSKGELVDYKFMCFSGKVKLILVHQDINNEHGRHTLDLYTPEWRKTDIKWGIPMSDTTLPRPSKLDDCIAISEQLSKGRKHVRVDLYIVDDHIYFGELTYYTAAGLKPFENYKDDLKIGEWIDITPSKIVHQ